MLSGLQGGGEVGILAPSWDGAHGQRVLLVDGVQLIGPHGMGDEVKLLGEGLEAIGYSDIGNVGAADVVALRTFFIVTGAKPVALNL